MQIKGYYLSSARFDKDTNDFGDEDTSPLIATGYLTGKFFRQYSRNIKGALGPLTRKTRLEKILVLLMESGSIYCFIWVCPRFFPLPWALPRRSDMTFPLVR